jgi:glucosyl-3-phosphoglycerate synthase
MKIWGAWKRKFGRGAASPIGVIIPTLFNDLSSPAMQHIIQELAAMNFVKRIYISLETSSEEEFQRAREIIQPIKDRGMLLWNGAPAVNPCWRKSIKLSLSALLKGRAVWTALGYALGKSEVSVLAFHDADIVTYDRASSCGCSIPSCICATSLPRAFIRYSDRLHGRVVRLFYFLRQSPSRYHRQIDFLDIGRLPLPALRRVRYLCKYCLRFALPLGLGDRSGILAEMYRNTDRTAFVRSRSRAVTTTNTRRPAKT